jgi:hypothetical protein
MPGSRPGRASTAAAAEEALPPAGRARPHLRELHVHAGLLAPQRGLTADDELVVARHRLAHPSAIEAASLATCTAPSKSSRVIGPSLETSGRSA